MKECIEVPKEVGWEQVTDRHLSTHSLTSASACSSLPPPTFHDLQSPWEVPITCPVTTVPVLKTSSAAPASREASRMLWPAGGSWPQCPASIQGNPRSSEGRCFLCLRRVAQSGFQTAASCYVYTVKKNPCPSQVCSTRVPIPFMRPPPLLCDLITTRNSISYTTQQGLRSQYMKISFFNRLFEFLSGRSPRQAWVERASLSTFYLTGLHFLPFHQRL